MSLSNNVEPALARALTQAPPPASDGRTFAEKGDPAAWMEAYAAWLRGERATALAGVHRAWERE